MIVRSSLFRWGALVTALSLLFSPISAQSQHPSTALAAGTNEFTGSVALPSTIGFHSTGSMIDPHRGGTLTLLDNGKVLAAGGQNPMPLYSSELYDPATGTTSRTDRMIDTNAYDAIVLQNGKVLVPIGAYPVGRTEIFDPLSGSWTSGASMEVMRSVDTLTLLNDGRVLATEGYDYGSTSELYDPVSGTWSVTGSLNVARRGASATLLNNGKVLIAGGSLDSFHGLPSAEIYDPATGTWSQTGNLNIGRMSHSATLLLNGKVLVAGGRSGDTYPGYLSGAELYDPNTGIWNLTGEMNKAEQFDPDPQKDKANYGNSAHLLNNGKVLVVHGDGSSELYDPSTASWFFTGSLNVPRKNFQMVQLHDGKVLLAGGISNVYWLGVMNVIEIYDPSTGLWSDGGKMIEDRYSFVAVVLNDGRVFMAGGEGNSQSTNAELFDPETGLWTRTGEMLFPRYDAIATRLKNGKVLVASGASMNTSVALMAELYDPTTGKWSQTSNLNFGGTGCISILLNDGKVLITGGQTGSNRKLTRTELYDPNTGTWSLTGDMNVGRSYAAAVLLDNGKVLVVGGGSGGELYDPDAGTWSLLPNLTNNFYYATATKLIDGKVLLTGDFATDSYLYDPLTGTITPTGPLNGRRTRSTATLISDGKVLLVGGYGNEELDNSELYDPPTGTWSLAGTMSVARDFPLPAILLDNHKVLVAGGVRDQNYEETISTDLGDYAPGNTITGTLILPSGWVTTGSIEVQFIAISSGAPVVATAVSNYYSQYTPLTWGPWVHTTPGSLNSTTWVQHGNEGNYPIQLRVRDANGLTAVAVTGTVDIDNNGPEGSVRVIPGSAVKDGSGTVTSVTLQLNATDYGSGVSDMRISSTDTYLEGTSWQPYQPTLSWPVGQNRFVFVQYRDHVGHTSWIRRAQLATNWNFIGILRLDE